MYNKEMILIKKCDVRSEQLLVCILFCVLIVLSVGCSGQQSQKKVDNIEEKVSTKGTFTMPEIPSVLTTPEQRSEYLVSHYWDNYNFADTSLINNVDVTEQAFADYVNLFPHTTVDVVEHSVSAMLKKAFEGSVDAFSHFTDLYEKYLYDPNSPFRNEDYYITILKIILANNNLDQTLKVRPSYQLELALKNRKGDIAFDFEYTTPNGGKNKISKIKSDYLVLFFNNPDCNECENVKNVLINIKNPSVKIVAIYVDEEIELWKGTKYPTDWINGYAPMLRNELLYDLRAIPTLYLLDKDKRVIYKDVQVDKIFDYFNRNL